MKHHFLMLGILWVKVVLTVSIMKLIDQLCLKEFNYVFVRLQVISVESLTIAADWLYSKGVKGESHG